MDRVNGLLSLAVSVAGLQAEPLNPSLESSLLCHILMLTEREKNISHRLLF